MSKFLDYEGVEIFTDELKKCIAKKIPDATEGSIGQVLGITANGTLGFIDTSSFTENLSNVSEAKF